MKLTPLNIKRHEFNKSFRGFNPEEVQSFLDELADEFEANIKEIDALKRKVEEQEEHIAEFKRIEKNLQDTLLKAQENSAKSIESTKKQTALMIKEAEIKASQLIEKAKESVDEMRNSIIKLREERDLIIAKLKAIVSTQAHLLERKVEKSDEAVPVVEKKQPEETKKTKVDIDSVLSQLL